jgi:hypothetical protein
MKRYCIKRIEDNVLLHRTIRSDKDEIKELLSMFDRKKYKVVEVEITEVKKRKASK